MNKKRKLIIGILVFAILVVGCVVCFYPKSSLRELAYQRCLGHVFGAEQEQREEYCNCVVNSPKDILDDNLYQEWLNSYGSDDIDAEKKFTQYDEINKNLTECFLEYAPFSTWLQFGTKWCTEKLGEDIKVCQCMFVSVGEEGEDTVRNMIAIESGLISIPDESEESIKEREQVLAELIGYCREHPFKIESNNAISE